MTLWVLVIGLIGAWILQRYAKRKRKAMIESEKKSWTDLK
jgi:hypothetical protein